MASKVDKDKLIAEYEKKQKQDKMQKIVLIIIIILLLIIFWVCYRMGRISLRNVSAEPGEESLQLVQVTDDDLEITKETELDIFKNKKFDFESVIAPRSSGTYSFCVENVSGKDVKYDLSFADEMKYLINMKYRLKIDNSYVKGSENSYVDLDQLNLSDVVVLKDSINVFTLEWYWEDDDARDTVVGISSKKNKEYYKLHMEVLAEEFIK